MKELTEAVAEQARSAGMSGYAARLPAPAFIAVSAIFHYLGPAFAVLLFARLDVFGVTWLRVASAAVVFAVWRRRDILRHRRLVLRRRQRTDHRTAARQTLRPAQRLRPRDQAVLPHGAGSQRPRPIPHTHHGLRRRLTAAAGRRLHRPVPDPPTGRRDTDRGDHGGAARRGTGRQGALPRRVPDVRVAVHEGPVHRAGGRLDPRRHDRGRRESSTATLRGPAVRR